LEYGSPAGSKEIFLFTRLNEILHPPPGEHSGRAGRAGDIDTLCKRSNRESARNGCADSNRNRFRETNTRRFSRFNAETYELSRCSFKG
jgi:hypothetical protein